jgi:hypothetical protein
METKQHGKIDFFIFLFFLKKTNNKNMEEQDLKCPSGLPLAFSSHAELLTCMHGSIQLGTTCGRQAVASQLFQHSTT